MSEKKTVTYVGPFDEVTVPAAGVTCRNGEPVEVDADLAAGLLEQPDNWQPAQAAKPKPKPTPAPATEETPQ